VIRPGASWRHVGMCLLLGIGLLFAAGAGASAAAAEMETVYLCFLKKGPEWTPQVTQELQELQKQHLAHLTRHYKLGHFLIAGPIVSQGHDLRGIVVIRAQSLEQAREWASEDPMVKIGRLAVEVHPWMVEKGIIKDPPVEGAEPGSK
jgi:uncharacterized protein